MPVVAIMTCATRAEHGGGTWLPLCEAFDRLEAWPPEAADLTSSGMHGHPSDACERCGDLHTGLLEREEPVPAWSALVRGKGSEEIKLTAVKSHAIDDPNNVWAVATPHGVLELTINNPRAWDFFEPGADYRIEITKRQPQKARV